MYKMIGGDGKEYGPVTAEQLRQWVAEGRVNAATRIQADGSTEWKALGSYPELTGSAAAAGAVPPVGAPSYAAPANAATLTAEAAARNYSPEAGNLIGRGWELIKNNFWLLVGGTALTFLMMGVAGVVPFVGGIIAIIVDGPLMGGLYLLYLRRQRNQPAEVGNIFDGFRVAFGQLILAHLIPGLLAALFILPGAVIGVISGIALAHGAKAAIVPLIIGIVLGIAGLCVMIYLGVCWAFTIPLVADKGLGFWEAMQVSRATVRTRFWSFFLVFFLCGLVSMVGLLGCIVGVFITGAIAMAAITTLYEDVFGARSTQTV